MVMEQENIACLVLQRQPENYLGVNRRVRCSAPADDFLGYQLLRAAGEAYPEFFMFQVDEMAFHDVVGLTTAGDLLRVGAVGIVSSPADLERSYNRDRFGFAD